LISDRKMKLSMMLREGGEKSSKEKKREKIVKNPALTGFHRASGGGVPHL